MSSDISPEARKDVNDAIINTSSSNIRAMIAASESSFLKRQKNKEEREKREAKDSKEQSGTSVRIAESPKTFYVLMVNRRAIPPAKNGLLGHVTKSLDTFLHNRIDNFPFRRSLSF